MTQPARTSGEAGEAHGSGLMKAGVALAALLVLAGGGAFWWASQRNAATQDPNGDAVRVSVRGKACEPNELTVPAGRTTFEIVNASDRAMEWEILDGVMVVEERENIAPGFSQRLSARLQPGTYEITCGLLNNPRGRLVVTPSASADADARRPALVAFVGPLAEYQVFLAMESGRFVKAVGALDAAIAAGDLAQARDLYRQARAPFGRIEPMTARFADLRNAIDPLPDYFAGREADPAFVGLHRLEYGLFATGSVDGLRPVSQRLASDAATLRDRLRSSRLSPEAIADAAARLLRALADTRIAAGEERYAQTDLADFDANIAGVAKMMGLLKPVAERAAPDVVARIDARLHDVTSAIAALRAPNGFPPYDQIDAAQRRDLADKVRALADAVASLNPAVGLG